MHFFYCIIRVYRVHFVENFLFGLRYALSVGFVTGIFIYLFGAKINLYMIFGVNALVFISSIFGSNLRHSHVPFSYFSFIEKWFLSPKQHQIHHDKKHFNKNYGGYIAIWDRVFGTLALSKDVNIFLLVPFILSAKNVALFINKFLYQNLGFVELNSFSYFQITIFYTIAIFVFSDFTRYWLHRFLHTIPFLWEFHKVHHGAKVLTPITFYRVHVVEHFLFGPRY